MTKLLNIEGGNIEMKSWTVDGDFEAIGDISDEAEVTMEDFTLHGYSDYGLRVKNSNLEMKDVDLESEEARIGLDLERNVTANIVDSTITGHSETDIQYGPGVLADLHDVRTREIYDKSRARSTVCDLSPNLQNLLLVSLERQLRREMRFNRLQQAGAVATTSYTVADLLGFGP